MKTQIFNPYLPESEYIPDGEPHLFDGRVYIYGSHDKAFGKDYCEGDYVVWSAPEHDLTNWRYEGVSYRKTQDPSNADGTKNLWAPDVCKGCDGRYYLYYCLSFHPEISVAVSDTPAGPFTFYGHIKYPKNIRNGAVLREFMPFDPAVLNDNGRIYLYYGFAPAKEKEMSVPDPDSLDIPEEEKEKLREIAKRFEKDTFSEYSMVAELDTDMLTLKEVPREMIPGGHHTDGTYFDGHGFFEASSIRKIGNLYYFVYSSHKSHELCYAVSRYPDRLFSYGGTLVSNGDIGFNGKTHPSNILGNNHGGMVKADNQWYIFYHRQTNGTEYSRQGCAEKLTILPDGHIEQVEITSCGLNKGPLVADGTYPAYIACHITDPTTVSVIDYGNPVLKKQTRVTSTPDGKHQYITDIQNESMIGYKYFAFKDTLASITLNLSGQFAGRVSLYTDEEKNVLIGAETIRLNGKTCLKIPVNVSSGTHALFCHFSGSGSCELTEFSFLYS